MKVSLPTQGRMQSDCTYLGRWASKTFHRQPPTHLGSGRAGPGRAGPGQQNAPACRLVLFCRATNTALHLASTSRPRYTCHTNTSPQPRDDRHRPQRAFTPSSPEWGNYDDFTRVMFQALEFLGTLKQRGRKLLEGRENCIICRPIFIRNHHEGTNPYAQHDCKWEVEL